MYGFKYGGRFEELNLRYGIEKGKEFLRRYGKVNSVECRLYKNRQYMHLNIRGTKADIERALRISRMLDDFDDCLPVPG